ncbi:MAG: aminopeptidase P family N-terminal domain-containing protein, partial [Candidatus Omnitrophica bacterium]|nr:aminopeptidase P family N-terminal domain-containing protein [Candidatus Omnitrophota bacterium]
MRNPDRVDRLKSRLRRLGLDALLISNPSNIYYLSGFNGHDSYSLITQDRKYIITDFRYTEQAEKETEGFEIIDRPSSLFKKTASLIAKCSLKRTGFESSHLTVGEADIISGSINKKLYSTFGLIGKLRAIKDQQEIKLIKRAAAIAKKAYK